MNTTLPDVKRVLVTGATGFTGQQVVRLLCAQDGIEVTAHVRPDSSGLQAWRTEFEGLGAQVNTTSWDVDAFTRTISQSEPDVVLFLIGTTKKRMKQLSKAGKNSDMASYEAIDYGLAHCLLESIIASTIPRPPKLVYLSAMGVGPTSPGAYMKVRWRFEEELRQSGVPHVIARPGLITGAREQKRPLEHLAGQASGAVLGVLGRLGAKQLNRRYRPTDDKELARALVRASLDTTMVATILESEELKD